MTKSIRKFFGSNTPDENYSRELRSKKDTAELEKSLGFIDKKDTAENENLGRPGLSFIDDDFEGQSGLKERPARYS